MAHFEELETKSPLKKNFPESVVARFRDRSQIDFEIGFYRTILEHSPNYVDVLRCQAELYSRKGMAHEGLQLERRLALLMPEDEVVRYNLACSLALVGRVEEAVAQLKEAVNLGYDDWLQIEADHDLDNLRDQADFQQFLRDFMPKAPY